MESIHVNNLMNVWKSNNTILKPIEKKVAIDFVEQIASLFSAGDYYYLIMNFETYTMEYVSDGAKSVLGIDPKTFSLEQFLKLLHPEDLQKIHEKEQMSLDFKLNKIPKEDITNYKTVYLLRVRSKNGTYKTILHQAKALSISDDGKVFQVLSIHTDITHLNVPIDHKISFISCDSNKPSFYAIDTDKNSSIVKNTFDLSFTKREIQILNEISKGKSFREIAAILYVSPHTINTHKKNILRKSNCNNTAELITKCIREGII